jgi:predicted nucleotidyltransferase
MLTKDEILNIINSRMGKLRADFSVNQVGLFGSAVHGYSRATLDIDLFIEPDKANAER